MITLLIWLVRLRGVLHSSLSGAPRPLKVWIKKGSDLYLVICYLQALTLVSTEMFTT